MIRAIARGLSAAAVSVVLQISSASATAGELLSCFSAGDLGSCDSVALAHVDFKSVILQYVDPDKTELGEGLARLLWREILESISDLSDAGVILAYERNGEIENALGEGDITAFLGREYHRAALKIAEQQDVEMAIWGSILEDGENLYVQNFLTLREPDDNPWTTLSLSGTRARPTPLATKLGRSRINLPPVRASREALFSRYFVTRCKLRAGCPDGIDIRNGPSNDAAVVAHVPAGTKIHTSGMHKQWLQLAANDTTTSAKPRWINLYHLEMFPLEITFNNRSDINLRRHPDGARIARVNLNGPYTVINATRHGQFAHPWYEIRVGDKQGWISGHLANRRSWSFPSIHLIAGLYRYGRAQYDRATLEFLSYLDLSPADDNVTRAEVYKFLAASRLAAGDLSGSRVNAALEEITRAVKLTPFDAGVYTLRSFVEISQPHTFDRAIGDLAKAIELDREDAKAQRLLTAVQEKLKTDEFRGSLSPASLEHARSRLKVLQRDSLR